MTAGAVRVGYRWPRALTIVLVCAVALCLHTRLSAGEGSTSEDGRKWILPGPIPAPPKMAPANRAGRTMEEIGEFVAVDSETRVFRANTEGEVEPIQLQVGDKLLVGDEVRVGIDSVAEVTLGLNARLRIGAGSVVRVLGKKKYPKTDNNVEIVKRDVELAHGSARVRVRKNELSPSPVLMISGDVQLMLNRADTKVERQSQSKKSTVMVFGGQAEVKLKTRGETGLEETRTSTLGEGQKMLVPDGTLKTVPQPVPMDKQELRNARGDMAFTVEQRLRRRPPPPSHDNELDGP